MPLKNRPIPEPNKSQERYNPLSNFIILPASPFVYLFCCLFVLTLFLFILLMVKLSVLQVSFHHHVAPFSASSVFFSPFLFWYPDNIKTWPEEFAELIQQGVEKRKENQSSKEKTTFFPIFLQCDIFWNSGMLSREATSYLQTLKCITLDQSNPIWPNPSKASGTTAPEVTTA